MVFPKKAKHPDSYRPLFDQENKPQSRSSRLDSQRVMLYQSLKDKIPVDLTFEEAEEKGLMLGIQEGVKNYLPWSNFQGTRINGRIYESRYPTQVSNQTLFKFFMTNYQKGKELAEVSGLEKFQEAISSDDSLEAHFRQVLENVSGDEMRRFTTQHDPTR